MWVVQTAGGEPVGLSQIEGQRVDARLVRDLARAHAAGQGRLDAWPLHLLDEEVLLRDRIGPLPGRDALAFWAGRALDDLASEREGAYVFAPQHEGLAVRNGSRLAVFGHELSVAVFGAAETLEVSYTAAQLTKADELWLEWRAYCGTASAVLQGLARLDKPDHPKDPGTRRARIALGSVSGFVVGMILRVSGKLGAAPQRADPSWPLRLRTSVKRASDLAGKHPELHRLPARPAITTLVHGTLSTCFDAFDPLFPVLPEGVARFEHDTFLPVNANAAELARLLRRPGTTDITLIAHSRGGLVARLAAAALQSSMPQLRIGLLMYGTPHLGTPLVRQGAGVMNVLFAAGSLCVGSVPVTPAGVAIWGYIIAHLGTLPDGIRDMDEEAGLIEYLHMLRPQGESHSWGGAYDTEADSDGFGSAFSDKYGRLAFSGDNDLVVPTSSACGAGRPHPVRGCSHCRYFNNADIRSNLQRRLTT